MGMSNYVLDLEEAFWGKVYNKITESEHISEAMSFAVELGKTEVPSLDAESIEEVVSEGWDEVWSQYVLAK
jgi:hypothetical protein